MKTSCVKCGCQAVETNICGDRGIHGSNGEEKQCNGTSLIAYARRNSHRRRALTTMNFTCQCCNHVFMGMAYSTNVWYLPEYWYFEKECKVNVKCEPWCRHVVIPAVTGLAMVLFACKLAMRSK